jgi:hypothetical protein
MVDFAQMLRLHDELNSVATLRARAATVAGESLYEHANLRERVLAWNLHQALGDEDFEDVFQRLQAYLQKLQDWASAPVLRPYQRESRMREVRDLRRHVQALRRSSEFSVPSEQPALAAGQTGFFNLWEMEPALEAARRLLFLGPDAGKSLLDDARRFPPSSVAGEKRMGHPSSVDLALVDRVDAVYSLFESFTVPRAWILLNQAFMLLGTSFRDFRMLNQMLHEDLDLFVRQAVVVAVGWLALPVPVEAAVTNRASWNEVSAWVLSVVLADWFKAEERLEQALPHLSGPAQRVVQTALMRLQAGAIFSVVG